MISCQKSSNIPLDIPINKITASKLDELSTELSKSNNLIKFISNLEIIQNAATKSSLSNSYLKQSNPNASEFIKKVYSLTEKDSILVSELINSQFSEGQLINLLIKENLQLSKKLLKEFPDLIKYSNSAKEEIYKVAISKILSKAKTGEIKAMVLDNICVKSCQKQYYISAGACGLLAETIVIAAVCFVAASMGLSACKEGCPIQ
jgi:hypothetical protein